MDERRDQELGPVVRGPRSFDEFYRSEFRQVLTLVSVLSGSRWAEDIAQEAMTRAYRRWDDVTRMEQPDAWVRVVAMNLARSRARRARSEVRALMRIGRPITELPPLEPEAARFWEEVRALPQRQAQVIALHYLEDRSVADVAGVLGISPNTVKVQLRNGRQRLAARLGAEEVS